MADAGPMINRCFRFQNPEAFGGEEVRTPSLTGIYGNDNGIPNTAEILPLEQMGNPEARPLDGGISTSTGYGFSADGHYFR